MSHSAKHNPIDPSVISGVEQDFLDGLLSPDAISYPWVPGDVASEYFFTELEADFDLGQWSAEEISSRSQTFFKTLNACWQQTELHQKLTTLMPPSLFQGIAQQAKQAIATPRPLVDQLVQCVQEILPQWSLEDLQVLARPLAFAMRESTPESVMVSSLESIRPLDWQDLSDIEQARVSLAAARYLLSQATENPDQDLAE